MVMTNLQLYTKIKKCIKDRVSWDREALGYHVHYNFYDTEIEIKDKSYQVLASIDIAYFWVFMYKLPEQYRAVLEAAVA